MLVQEYEVQKSESNDITRVDIGGKELVLIGTAHISQRSVEVVRATIEAEQPDTVAVELDQGRYDALTNKSNWESLDLIEVIKKRQTTFLVARLALMAFQKRMSSYTGVKPGAEMLAAIHSADEIDAEVLLADRDIQTTLLRAWRTTPFYKRASVAGLMFMGLFEKTEVSEDSLEDLRDTHNISEILDELGEVLPEVKSVLVDERDLYMAYELLKAPGDKIVAVVGAAHKAGILRILASGKPSEDDIERVMHVPKKSVISKAIPWILPVLVISAFVAGFIYGDRETFTNAATAWFIVNAAGAALGTTIALAHPLTILATALAAPFTSLNPTIGAGMVAGLVQTLVSAPKVKDFETLGDDMADWKGWWKNRLARVLLCFILGNLGSMVGTFAAFPWLKDLIN